MNPQALQQISELLSRIPPFGPEPPEGLFSTLQEAGIYLADVKARLRTQTWLAQKVGLPGAPEFLVDYFNQATSLADYERFCQLLDETEADEVRRCHLKVLAGMALKDIRTLCLILATALGAEAKENEELKAARDEARTRVRTRRPKEPRGMPVSLN